MWMDNMNFCRDTMLVSVEQVQRETFGVVKKTQEYNRKVRR